MNRPVKLKDTIEGIIKGFNKNNENAGNKERYRIEIQEREFQVNIKKNKKSKPVPAKLFVGRLILFLDRDNKSIAIFHLDTPLDSTYSQRLTKDWHNELYKQFLYETIGFFALGVTGMIDRREKAALDVEKNRFEQDIIYKDKKVKIINTKMNGVEQDNLWFNLNEEFEIFTKGETGWAVFSNREDHQSNKGIGIVPFQYCKIIEESI